MLVSTYFFNSSKPLSAAFNLPGPSKIKGFVTTATVNKFKSLAALAITGAAPVPVPPPIPAVMKTMLAPCKRFINSFNDSSAAACPISDFAPAPSPLVKLVPSCILHEALLCFKACASVFAATNSTP